MPPGKTYLPTALIVSSPPSVLPDLDDASVADAHSGGEDVRRHRDRAAADEEVECHERSLPDIVCHLEKNIAAIGR
jgi:hypothetical protein